MEKPENPGKLSPDGAQYMQMYCRDTWDLDSTINEDGSVIVHDIDLKTGEQADRTYNPRANAPADDDAAGE